MQTRNKYRGSTPITKINSNVEEITVDTDKVKKVDMSIKNVKDCPE